MIALGTTITLNFCTSDATTGEPTAPDALPSVAVYEDANDTPILSPTPVARSTGQYRVQVVCTTGNGFESGKSYNVMASATVGGVDGVTVLATFLVGTAWTSTIEGSLTAEDVMKVLLAYAAGKTEVDDSVTPPVVTFRNQADTLDRITAEVTGSERTSVTLDNG